MKSKIYGMSYLKLKPVNKQTKFSLGLVKPVDRELNNHKKLVISESKVESKIESKIKNKSKHKRKYKTFVCCLLCVRKQNKLYEGLKTNKLDKHINSTHGISNSDDVIFAYYKLINTINNSNKQIPIKSNSNKEETEPNRVIIKEPVQDLVNKVVVLRKVMKETNSKNRLIKVTIKKKRCSIMD